jgi:hypothetical protein
MLICGCRYNEGLKVKTEGSSYLTYTWLSKTPHTYVQDISHLCSKAMILKDFLLFKERAKKCSSHCSGALHRHPHTPLLVFSVSFTINNIIRQTESQQSLLVEYLRIHFKATGTTEHRYCTTS